MRVLVFDVTGQKLEKSETCNFDGIVPGTNGYLKARFVFDKSWNGYVKAAVFKERKNESAVAIKDNMCTIPEEVLTRRSFTVQVYGRDRAGSTIKTNLVTVDQRG